MVSSQNEISYVLCLSDVLYHVHLILSSLCTYDLFLVPLVLRGGLMTEPLLCLQTWIALCFFLLYSPSFQLSSTFPPISSCLSRCLCTAYLPVSLSLCSPLSSLEEEVENFDVSSLQEEAPRNIEADSFWCMSKLLDGIQVRFSVCVCVCMCVCVFAKR